MKVIYETKAEAFFDSLNYRNFNYFQFGAN